MPFKLIITKNTGSYSDKIQITDDQAMPAKDLQRLILSILEIEQKEERPFEVTIDEKNWVK